jgi:hypothetical protein
MVVADYETTIGVGDGSTRLFVHGPYEAVKRVQGFILAAEKAARLRKALELLVDHTAKCEQQLDGFYKVYHAGESLPLTHAREVLKDV